MKLRRHTAKRRRLPRAFTLLELMVSMAVLALLMLLVFQMLEQTQKTWSNSRARVSTFKEARVAFEGVTRRVGQAMLNTYFDYKYPGNNPRNKPTGYERKSDLHFISGHSSDLLSGVDSNTHCIFFQAPLGYSLLDENQRFSSLLNSWGYYIERNDDREFVPDFIVNADGFEPRMRYRLMEFRPPAENMAVYAADLKNGYKTDWFKDYIPDGESAGGVPFSRPIAENIIALIIEPMESQITGSNTLSPNYEYDSRRFQKGGGANDPTKHQLPPLVRITMVAIDEDSAIRYEQVTGGELTDLVPSSLFKNTSSFEVDLRNLQQRLDDLNLEYRIFTETVSIRASRFSDPAFQ